MKRSPRPVVITDAERSQRDQLRSREVRYLLMMSFRALCLVAAAVLAGTHVPLKWLWIAICLVGMVLVPWMAVLIANDRPPRRRDRRSTAVSTTAPPERAPEALSAAPAVRIIDADGIVTGEVIAEPRPAQAGEAS